MFKTEVTHPVEKKKGFSFFELKRGQIVRSLTSGDIYLVGSDEVLSLTIEGTWYNRADFANAYSYVRFEVLPPGSKISVTIL